MEFSIDMNSEGVYYWSHSLISDATYELINSVCNTSQLWRERIRGSLSAACRAVSAQLSSEIPFEIDDYDVTADVCVSSGQSRSQSQLHKHPLRPKFQFSLQEGSNQPVSTPGTHQTIQATHCSNLG